MSNGIFKDGIEIQNLEDWRLRAGPKKASQWKDGRSAKESARYWLATNQMPAEFSELLQSHSDFDAIVEWRAEPEAPVRIDDFRGEPPNIDVLVRAQDRLGSIAIVVEAKADEPFGALVADKLKDVETRLRGNPKSKGKERLLRLSTALFGVAPIAEAVSGLRYQLLTACGAALAEAARMEADRAVVLVHEFLSCATDSSKRKENQKDYLKFLSTLNASLEVEASLFGPLVVPGSPLVENTIKLYLGKVISDIRTSILGSE